MRSSQFHWSCNGSTVHGIIKRAKRPKQANFKARIKRTEEANWALVAILQMVKWVI